MSIAHTPIDRILLIDWQRIHFFTTVESIFIFAPIGLHKTDTVSDWLLIKRQSIGTKGLAGVQLQNYLDSLSYRRDFSINRREDVTYHLKIRGASEKFKNNPRPLLRPSSVNLCHNFWNLPPSHILILSHLFLQCLYEYQQNNQHRLSLWRKKRP